MALKYSLTYNDIENVAHLVEFYIDAFIGTAQTDLVGRAYLTTPSVDDPLESIRGSGIRIELEATSARTFEDLFTEEEMIVNVKYYRDSQIIFNGWLNPENWYESLNSDVWMVSFDAVDGMGYFEGLSYVTSTGLFFTGKQSAVDIISNCLARTKLQQDIYVDVNLRYVGLSGTADIMKSCYFNAERFYQSDKEPMGCQEVLKTTLDVFNAVIVQRRGAWYVYRPNQLFNDSEASFFHYDYLGVSAGANVVIELSETIWTKENAPLSTDKFHVNSNQQLTNVKTLGGFSVSYQYGAAKSLLGNNKYLEYDGATYADWSINNGPPNLTFPVAGGNGVTMNVVPFASSILQMTSQATITIAANDEIEYITNIQHVAYPFTTQNYFNFEITLFGTPNYYLTQTGAWSTSPATLSYSFVGVVNDTIRISAEPAPVPGNVQVRMYTPTGSIALGTMQVLTTELVYSNDEIKDKKGETHIALRTPAISSKIDDPFDVFVGDNALDTYVGSIYKLDTFSNTDEWTRDIVAETKPLLQIMVEDRLRLTPQIVREFSGDVYGFVDYLSVVSLAGYSGIYLVIDYEYDTMMNITKLKLREIQGGELADIDYKMSIDYANVIKPKIKG